jgi:molybdopterin/thiamine biosynthesis adenylyltransferase
MALKDFLAAAAEDGHLPFASELEAARRFSLDAHDVEGAALRAGLLPERYARNLGSIGLAGQLALHESRVAVIGCGGLGGFILEGLGRLGVGNIVAVDPDRFEASNLNRQLLATVENLGESKAEAAVQRLRAVNPALRCRGLVERLDASNADRLLAGCNAAADALDSIADRLTLAAAASRLGVALVHGSVAGRFGQAATQLPGEDIVARIYAGAQAERGIEVELGTLVFAPAVVAGLQVAELCHLLLGEEPGLKGRMLALDLGLIETSAFKLDGVTKLV